MRLLHEQARTALECLTGFRVAEQSGRIMEQPDEGTASTMSSGCVPHTVVRALLLAQTCC